MLVLVFSKLKISMRVGDLLIVELKIQRGTSMWLLRCKNIIYMES